MILSRLVYDGQFSFVTIYKVVKCMMPGVLKICSHFKKSCSVFQPLVVFFLDRYDRFLMDDMPLSSLAINYSYVLILSS